MMGYGYRGMMGGFGIGMIIPLLLIGVIVYAVIRLIQSGNNNRSNRTGGNDALDILNRRYANGEISDEEYTKKKKMLGY